ncbi:MAG: hypothetical protein ACLTL8_08215 [Bifidobacterium pseudocatenulatum]
MQIIKPHGSLNWYSYGNDGEVILKRIREEREYDETVSQNKLDARENEKLAVTGRTDSSFPRLATKRHSMEMGLTVCFGVRHMMH